MTPKELTASIQEAQEALRTFLTNTLGSTSELNVARPVQEQAASVADDAASHVVLHSPNNQAAVVLQAEWVGLLSAAILGEPRQAGDPDTEALLQDVAAEAYRALQQQLATGESPLPDATFQVLLPGSGQPSLPEQVWKVPFSVKTQDQRLNGFAVLPTSPPSEAGNAPHQQSQSHTAPEASPSHQPPSNGGVDVAPASFSDLGEEKIGGDGGGGDFDLLADVELEITVELGRRRLPLADLLHLTTGSVIELEKLVGEPLEIYANGRLIAEGEAVVIDEQFGVRITNLTSERQRKKAFI